MEDDTHAYYRIAETLVVRGAVEVYIYVLSE